METKLKKLLIEIANKEECQHNIVLNKIDRFDYEDGIIRGAEIQHQLFIHFCNWKNKYTFHKVSNSKYVVTYENIGQMVFDTLEDLYEHWEKTDEYKQSLETIKNKIK